MKRNAGVMDCAILEMAREILTKREGAGAIMVWQLKYTTSKKQGNLPLGHRHVTLKGKFLLRRYPVGVIRFKMVIVIQQSVGHLWEIHQVDVYYQDTGPDKPERLMSSIILDYSRGSDDFDFLTFLRDACTEAFLP